ncbi:hypothetical protein LCGC14_0249380 [marine sediment metagenome]|uniref:Uncharacterized protein n=1 Tax=marine sediment metagenome TaxID=412755 RepID=A0A0F9U571_9ZZZZ
MTSENTVTGRLGKHVVGTTLVARITNWAVNRTLASTSEWGDSDSGGFTNRAAGRKDGTFTTEGKFDTDSKVFDLFQPEDIAIGTLWLNTTLYWDFPRALNNDFALTVDVDTEEVIGWTSGWGADGVFHYPGEAGAAARVLP